MRNLFLLIPLMFLLSCNNDDDDIVENKYILTVKEYREPGTTIRDCSQLTDDLLVSTKTFEQSVMPNDCGKCFSNVEYFSNYQGSNHSVVYTVFECSEK